MQLVLINAERIDGTDYPAGFVLGTIDGDSITPAAGLHVGFVAARLYGGNITQVPQPVNEPEPTPAPTPKGKGK